MLDGLMQLFCRRRNYLGKFDVLAGPPLVATRNITRMEVGVIVRSSKQIFPHGFYMYHPDKPLWQLILRKSHEDSDLNGSRKFERLVPGRARREGRRCGEEELEHMILVDKLTDKCRTGKKERTVFRCRQ